MATLYIDESYVEPDYFGVLDGARVVLLEVRIPLIVLETRKKVVE